MQGRKTFTIKVRILLIMISILILWGAGFSQICYASLPSEDVFENITWEKVSEVPRVKGVVQSICSTDDYIICIENYSDETMEPDIVSAYYKNDVDTDGSPVEQYSLAKEVRDTNYEHANGMAYNPNTNEILVTAYTALNPDNRGCIFIMDADNLTYKGKVKISDDYNLLGIDYKQDTNQYIIQTDSEGGYSFKILDSAYQLVEDLGEYAATSKGNNFQDLCVDGDYIINFPLTLFMGIGDFINIYSISQKTLLGCYPLNFNFEDNVTMDEPESICQTAPGEFLAVVNTSLADGSQTSRLYKTKVLYNFSVTTSAENATVSDGSNIILRGGDYTVVYSPAKKNIISSVLADGKKVDLKKHPTSFTFENIQQNHTLQIITEKSTLANWKYTPLLIRIGIVLLVMTAAIFLIYIRLLHVRRVRALKRRRAKRQIQQRKYEM